MLTEIKIHCYHCGDECDDTIMQDLKSFCCEGCKAVYEILQTNDLCTYYGFEAAPGIKGKGERQERFAYLDEKKITDRLISFSDQINTHITFYIPAIHCSSCVWLLENLHRLNTGVISSQIEFLKKEIHIVFNNSQTSVRAIVELLVSIGYEPLINLEFGEIKQEKKTNKLRIYRIGVAGFCFGNIMMLSLPEYFSGGAISEPGLKQFFSYLNLFLALPVFFFSSTDFFSTAWKGLKQQTISIDVPVSMGIIAMFTRSVYEIISQTGPGYFDSMSGLVFFMLIGRKFQEYTFDSLSFEHNYKSYFPIAVTVIKNNGESYIPVNDLRPGDNFLAKNGEIIPADALLKKGIANIDYSFVTGESEPTVVYPGATIFAGGKHTGTIIELQALKEVSQSRLTHLWNKNTFNQDKNSFQKTISSLSRWFIVVTLAIAFAAGLFWWRTDIKRAINAFTTILVIACPCALALSAPFTFGNVLRFLGKRKIYIKDTEAVEKLADIDTVVFDKTGTLTRVDASAIHFSGVTLNDEQKGLIHAITRQSMHPLSRRINSLYKETTHGIVSDYIEVPGQGIKGKVNGIEITLGRRSFVINQERDIDSRTKVWLKIEDTIPGCFVFENIYRDGAVELISKLKNSHYRLAVITGDGRQEENNLRKMFGKDTELCFHQSPEDKLNYVRLLQQTGRKVLMIGDGLNDAGALLQSNIGISLSDNINNFTPASNVILDASRFTNIQELLRFSKSALRIIIWSFIISLLYNFIGLYYAVQGTLSPVIAAILMPISTSSLVLFTVIASTIKGKRFFGKL